MITRHKTSIKFEVVSEWNTATSQVIMLCIHRYGSSAATIGFTVLFGGTEKEAPAPLIDSCSEQAALT